MTILVVTGFILGSLQAVVLSTILRVQAQDKNEVLNWIQQDLELIRFQAFNLPENNANCGSYGSALQTQIETIHSPDNDFILGLGNNQRSYSLRREYTDDNNTLQIIYVVAYGLADDSSSTESSHPRYNTNFSYDYDEMIPVEDFRNSNSNYVTTLSTEVIPNVALGCP